VNLNVLVPWWQENNNSHKATKAQRNTKKNQLKTVSEPWCLSALVARKSNK